MAISTAFVWEVRTTASAGNVNGGGFKTGASGTDYSQQNGPQYSLTGLTTAAANAIILTASASADMVGNIIFVDTAATNFLVGRYEILSVVVGVSITVDRNCTSAAGAAGTAKIGGALSLGSSDSTVFNQLVTGNIMYVQAGTYTIGGTVTITTAGTTTVPIVVKGYNSSRGDNPTGVTRPLFNCGANTFTTAANWDLYYLQFNGTASAYFVPGASPKLINVKATNTSLTSNINTMTSGANGYFFGCEFVSENGYAVRPSGGHFVGCTFHSSVTGIYQDNVSQICVEDCLFIGNNGNGIWLDAAVTNAVLIKNCTFYGFEVATGTGIKLNNNGITNVRVINNIFYGLATGVSHTLAGQTVGYDDYNMYNNCTANTSNWTLGPHSITTAPSFSSVSNLTGTTATTSGSVLTQGGGDFSTVTNNVDYLYLVSGTGVTSSNYLITNHTATTVTLDVAPGTSAVADKVWKIVTGRNFNPGTNAKGAGIPVALPNSSTTSFVDLGTAQRQEFISTDPGIANVANGVGYSIQGASFTGTSVNTDPGAANVATGVTYTILSSAKTGTLVTTSVAGRGGYI